MTNIYLPDGTIPMPKSGGTFTDKVYLEDANTYLDNVAGDLEIHVAAGKKVKIVVG